MIEILIGIGIGVVLTVLVLAIAGPIVLKRQMRKRFASLTVPRMTDFELVENLPVDFDDFKIGGTE